MTADLDRLCQAMQRTVAAIPPRFELVATDPITGAVMDRIDVGPHRARTFIAQLIEALQEAERRSPRRAIDNLYGERSQQR